MSVSKPGLSLVIPIFNEAQRIENMFETLEAFRPQWPGQVEVILVDDGSLDQTKSIINTYLKANFANKENPYTYITYPSNKGKGFALKTGVQKVTLPYFLTLDADMSAKPQMLLKWLESSKLDNSCIFIGSREHQYSKVNDKIIRRWAGRAFNFTVRAVSGLKFYDTQCGFKLYPVQVGKFLFNHLHSSGWEHDVELLKMASLIRIPVYEKPVEWNYQPHSKLKLWRDGLITIIKLFQVRRDLQRRAPKLKSAFMYTKFAK